MSRRNPKIPKKGIQQRKRHKGEYYTARIKLYMSPAIKQGIAEICELEGRSASWVMAEVIRMFFGLKDDTTYYGIGHKLLRPRKNDRLRLVK